MPKRGVGGPDLGRDASARPPTGRVAARQITLTNFPFLWKDRAGESSETGGRQVGSVRRLDRRSAGGSCASRLWLGLFIGLLAAAPAVAQPTPGSTRDLTNPLFFPHRGEILGETDSEYATGSSTQSNTAGAFAGRSGAYSNVLNQSFQYGVLDRLAVTLADDYVWGGGTNSFASGGGRKTRSRGFDDPSLGLRVLALQQGAYPVTFVLSGAYAPDIVAARAPDARTTGSEASGQDVLTLQAAVQRVGRIGVAQLSLIGVRYGGAVVSGSMGSTTTSSARWEPALDLLTQIFVSDRAVAYFGVRETFAADYSSYLSPSGVATLVSPGDETDMNGGIYYQIVPNRLVGILGYGHSFYGSGARSVPEHPILDTRVERGNDRYVVSLRYAFH